MSLSCVVVKKRSSVDCVRGNQMLCFKPIVHVNVYVEFLYHF